jgi:hypothetical protein
VLFYSILAELGLSVENWPENGVFQWNAGPRTGSFSGKLARERGLSVENWPGNGVFQWNAGPRTGSFSGMLAREWGLSVECWPENVLGPVPEVDVMAKRPQGLLNVGTLSARMAVLRSCALDI